MNFLNIWNPIDYKSNNKIVNVMGYKKIRLYFELYPMDKKIA